MHSVGATVDVKLHTGWWPGVVEKISVSPYDGDPPVLRRFDVRLEDTGALFQLVHPDNVRPREVVGG